MLAHMDLKFKMYYNLEESVKHSEKVCFADAGTV